MKTVKHYKNIYKQQGVKGVVREGGYKVLILLFLFFLVKGLLWLLIPYLIARGVMGN